MTDFRKTDGFADPEAYIGIQVEVMNRMEAEKYCPLTKDEVCISIKSESEYALGFDREAKLHPNFADVLYLSFDDTGVELVGMEDKTAKKLTDDDIRKIVSFVVKHMDKEKLVIHCFAGISRSRSMAAAICDHFHLPYQYTVNNRSVYDKVIGGFKNINV